ncbi:hypothetical protein BASA60_001977 [Batrachochytrium salamandrivorans]|nr:hypothetical protein BASA60_001977 [Batrachochytrium salamandrivorans]
MFGPALTLVLALVSSAVIAVPTVNNVYKRSAASLDSWFTELPFHFPESVYESILYNDLVLSLLSETDDVKTATDYIYNRLNLDADDFKVFDYFTDSAGITHVYGAHMTNGVRIVNHQAAAHVKNGQVTYFSSSFGTEQHFSKRDLIISAPEATLNFEQVSVTVSAKLNIPIYFKIEYVLDGIQVWCDANTGEVVQAVNFAHKASYKAIPVPRRDPTAGFSMVVDPEFIGSSPNGWTDGKVTGGNNVITFTPSGKTTPSIRDGVFDTKFNGDDEPDTDDNIAATAVNLFYITNVMHDISYQYGFTEQAGNFQTDNFDKGGQGNDAVVINVLNSSDNNNAGFFTPPDGQPGEMNLYLFNYTTPNRTPGLDNGIVLHEYAHGITNRLTGGPSISSCLTSLRQQQVSRSHPYTTDMEVNPLTYGGLKTLDEVHDMGEVWASMLWEVYWNLVTKHGFSSNLYDASQSEGNIVAMKIILGGLMIQQCNPTFRAARDAIVAADLSYYDGANKCEILRAFAKRGLGSEATSGHKNDFSIPI